MLINKGKKIVCNKFVSAGIYKEILKLDDETVIFCSKGVIEDFQDFISTNVRLTRVINKKRIELKPLRQEKPQPPKNLIVKDASEKAIEKED